MSERFTEDFEHDSCATAVHEVTDGRRAYHGPVCAKCLSALQTKFSEFLDAVRKLMELGET